VSVLVVVFVLVLVFVQQGVSLAECVSVVVILLPWLTEGMCFCMVTGFRFTKERIRNKNMNKQRNKKKKKEINKKKDALSC